MPNETITEEQEQVSRLQQRWINYDARRRIFTGIAVIVFIDIDGRIGGSSYISTAIILPLIFLTVYFLRHWSLQRFVRRLSKEDRALILRVEQNPKFASLVKVCKIDAKKEYLRPSNDPNEDTLLRAAQYTDETPKEQLLRPAQTAEK